MVLVPYWRSLKAETFLELHHTMGSRLYRYFAPLTIAATVVPTLAAVVCVVGEGAGWMFSLPASLLVLANLGIYAAYFKAANESFATGSVGGTGLASELQRWSRWHWLRTVMIIAALALELCALAFGQS